MAATKRPTKKGKPGFKPATPTDKGFKPAKPGQKGYVPPTLPKQQGGAAVAMAVEPVVESTVDAQVVAAIPERTIYLELHQGMFNPQRSGDLGTVETTDDKKLLRLARFVIDPKHLDDVRYEMTLTANWVRRRAVPSPLTTGTGIYLLPIALAGQVDEYLRSRKPVIDGEVEHFMDHFDEYVADARARTPKHLHEQVQPREQVRRSFYMSWRFFELAAPKNLATLSEVLWQDEKAKAEQAWNGAAGEIRSALRESFAGLVSHFAHRLSPDEEGNRRSMHQSLIPNIMEFLDTFEARNLTNDAELAALVGQAKGMLSGVAVDDLKKHEGLRQHIHEEFARIATATDSMVVSRTRRIDLED